MSEYKFYYFNVRAKGEIVRLIFAAAGVQYEDIRYNPPMAENGYDNRESLIDTNLILSVSLSTFSVHS